MAAFMRKLVTTLMAVGCFFGSVGTTLWGIPFVLITTGSIELCFVWGVICLSLGIYGAIAWARLHVQMDSIQSDLDYINLRMREIDLKHRIIDY
jgi:hypothetical protein